MNRPISAAVALIGHVRGVAAQQRSHAGRARRTQAHQAFELAGAAGPPLEPEQLPLAFGLGRDQHATGIFTAREAEAARHAHLERDDGHVGRDVARRAQGGEPNAGRLCVGAFFEPRQHWRRAQLGDSRRERMRASVGEAMLATVASGVAQIVRVGMPVTEYWKSYPSRVTALTRDEVTAVARSLDASSQWAWVIVGDRSRLEAPLRAARIGRVVTP